MNPLSPIWDFYRDPANDFGAHTHDFLYVALLALFYSIIIGVALGVISAQNRQLAFIATNLSGIGRAIPTFAFLGLAAALPGALGLDNRSAIIALTILGIPPVLLNTIAGLQGIDPAMIDTARGVGMTRIQALLRVQLPLVLPVVAAGVRTAAVTIIATTPLITFIGLGGYGEWIVGGLGNNTTSGTAEVYAGALPVVALALLAEYGLAAAQRALTPVGVRKPTASTTERTADTSTPDTGKGVMTA